MTLSQLKPYWVRYETRIEKWTRVIGDPKTWKSGDPTEIVTGPREYTIPVKKLADAQGIEFLCPKCFAANGGERGTHLCSVTFEGRGVESHQGAHNKAGQPTRWSVSGTSLKNLTIAPSILIEDSCGWHGFITNGEVTGG